MRVRPHANQSSGTDKGHSLIDGLETGIGSSSATLPQGRTQTNESLTVLTSTTDWIRVAAQVCTNGQKLKRLKLHAINY